MQTLWRCTRQSVEPWTGVYSDLSQEGSRSMCDVRSPAELISIQWSFWESEMFWCDFYLALDSSSLTLNALLRKACLENEEIGGNLSSRRVGQD